MKLMGGKIKKFFLSFSRFNKPAVLAAVFFSVFFGLVLPLHSAQAFLGALATAIGMAVAVTVLNIVLQFILFVSNLILGLAGVILNWVISPYFMSLPYTYGGIVDIGWPIVRDFINMFFIIALVVIGLATALRIKEYQAQKTLPLLIIIAILINFTPVICGVIIDASNILMNFFLEELTGFSLLGNLLSTQGTMITGAFTGILNPLEAFSLMGKALIMIIFDWVAAFIFFMFALLFIMRYVMIWVLVIVSPIAFFSRIFPASQKYLFKSILGWDEWWKQFIEWSMIGVIAGFFLYLAEQLMSIAPGWIPGIAPGGAWGIITTPLVDFINQLLPWGVMLAFLIIGFFVATSTSAMGATAITSFFREKGVGMAKAAGRGVTTLAAMGGLRYLGKPAETVARRLETMGGPWVDKKGVKGVVAKVLTPARLAGAQLRRAPAALKERVTGGIGEQEKGMAGKSAETQATGWNEGYQRATATGFGWEKAIGSLGAGIKSGNLGDIQTKLGLSDEEMKAMVKRTATEAAKYGKQKEILQTGLLKDSDIEDVIKGARLSKEEQDIYGLKLSEADEEKYKGSIYKKIIAEMKRSDISHLSKSVATNKEGKYPEAQEEIQRWPGPQLDEAARTFGSAFVDSYMAEGKKREDEHPGWHMENAPKGIRYLTGTAARDLGFDPSLFKASPRGWTPPEGWRPPPGYTSEGPPPGWTPAMRIKKGWTWTPPAPVARPRKEAELPELKPSPTERERREFRAIAEGGKPIPETGKLESRLRKMEGAIRELSILIQEQQTALEDKIKEIEEKRETIGPAELHDLEEERGTTESTLSEHQDRQLGLSSKIDEIKKQLTSRVRREAEKRR